MRRLNYIDIAKGISIIAIVLGHAYIYSTSNGDLIIPIVYSFHVPIFFIISGLIIGIKNKDKKVNINIKNKFKSLMIPFFVYSLIYQLFFFLLAIIGGASIKDQLIMRISTILKLGSGAMWFLPVLFISEIIVKYLLKLNKYFSLFVSVLLLILGMIAPEINSYMGILLKSFIGVFFINVGIFFCDLFICKAAMKKLLILFIINSIIIFVNGTVSLAGRTFGNELFYIIESILGSWIIIQISIKIENLNFSKIKEILIFNGKNSLFIMGTHQMIIECLRLIDYKMFNSCLINTGIYEGLIITFIIIIMDLIVLKLNESIKSKFNYNL